MDAKQKRQHFYQSEMTNAFRLFNQDGDNFGGMTVDLYDEYAVFHGIIPLFILSKR